MLQSMTECYRVLQRVTECYRVLQSITEYNGALQSFTQNYRVLQSITECYRVLQSITEYYRVLQSITEYYRALEIITNYYKDKSSASTWTNFWACFINFVFVCFDQFCFCVCGLWMQEMQLDSEEWFSHEQHVRLVRISLRREGEDVMTLSFSNTSFRERGEGFFNCLYGEGGWQHNTLFHL